MTHSQLNLNEQRAPRRQVELDARLAKTLGVSRRTNAEAIVEQALLRRCMVRLRLNRAWILAAGLGDARLDDGSWPSASGPSLGDNRIIPTVTAVSALALADFQPGLYFGSDLPRPRRLQES